MAGDASFFEDLDSQESVESRKPFFKLIMDGASESQLLDWFKEEINYLMRENEDRLQKVKDNFKRYKNMQYREQVYQPRDLPEKRTKYMPQMVKPYIRDIVDEKTARLMKYKPSIAIIPMHDEQSDKADSKVAKKFLSHIDTQEKTDLIFLESVRNSKIAGEYFNVITWNPDKGPEVKGAIKYAQEYGRSVNIGDIEIKMRSPLDVLYERTRKFSDVNYFFDFDFEYTEGLKLDYPEKADQIKERQHNQYYDPTTGENVYLEGKTMKIRFFHRKTKFLPKGYEACFTMDVILKKGPLSYDHGELPWVRWVDSPNPEEAAATPFIEYTRSMASQINNMDNMFIKQFMLCAHPKWFIDKGSTDVQSLNNDTGIVQLLPGSRQPLLAQGNPVSPQAVEFAKGLREEFYRLNKSSSVIQGEPPSGVTAFVALQFVSEQESQRLNQDVIYFGQSVKDFYSLSLKTCGQFYKKEDERTLQIMGKDNRWTIEQYDPEVLSKPYSIIMQNQTSLPESKAARTQMVVDMGDKYPEMFSREQLIEMLGLAQADKFFDEASSAAASAEDENEFILDGKGMIEPAEWENHLVHWRIHYQQMQSIGFKIQTPQKIQQALKAHLLATEMMIEQQMKKSPIFAQMVQTTCPQFPVLLATPAPMPMAPLPPQDIVANQAAAAQSPDQEMNMMAPEISGQPMPVFPEEQEAAIEQGLMT